MSDLAAMHAFARDQLKLVDPPGSSAVARLLGALRNENDRLRRDLKAAVAAKWEAEDEARTASTTLQRRERELDQVRRDLSSVLHPAANARSAGILRHERPIAPAPADASRRLSAPADTGPAPRTHAYARAGAGARESEPALSPAARALMNRPERDPIGEAEERRMAEDLR